MASATVPVSRPVSVPGGEELETNGHKTEKRKMESTKDLDELRRVQIANEGMRLLLNSRLKEAEELFKTTR